MAGGQPRPDLVDRLDAMTSRWDELVGRARLGTRSIREFHEIEERAQHFADDLIATVRGPGARRPSTGSVVGGDRRGAWG